MQNFDMTTTAPLVPFRDSTLVAGDGATLGYGDMGVSGHLQEIEDSGVAIYHMGGWFDGYTRDTLTMQATMTNPGKMLMWPYNHLQLRDLPAGSPDLEMSSVEHVRWFDWCLKGIDNGIDKEPPYYYYVMGKDEWRFSDQWPLPEQKPTPYYLGRTAALATAAPTEADAFDEYVTDYNSTSGPGTRWLCLTGGNCEYGDRAVLDKKNLTYTTAPLEQDLEVTGHPIAHLFLSSTATDGALFVYLEDVDENGAVTYVTEGELKALAAQAPAPAVAAGPALGSRLRGGRGAADARPGGGDSARPAAHLLRVPEGPPTAHLHRRLGQDELRGTAVRPAAHAPDVPRQRPRVLRRDCR